MCWADQVKWVEVALTVTPEQAEAVAEVLGRFTREGVVVEQIALPNEGGDEVMMSPHVRVFGYLLANEGLEDHKQRLAEALWYLSRIQPLPTAHYRPIKDQNWMEAWKQHYQPIQIGQRLEILPAWAESPNPERLPVRINPGMAFGTGTHPTTQLCLQLMETYLQPGQPVFDIGCGSGILSIAAVRLGASRVYAVDVDPVSVASTTENCQLNHVEGQVDIEQGSLPLMLGGRGGSPQAALVVANILASVILRMLENGLADAVQAGGVLLLSGILDEQANEIIQTAQGYGMVHLKTACMEDWVALALRRPDSL